MKKWNDITGEVEKKHDVPKIQMGVYRHFVMLPSVQLTELLYKIIVRKIEFYFECKSISTKSVWFG